MMLTHQPLFVSGIEDITVARSSAFGSCYMYCATFGISLVLIYRDSRKKRRDRILARQLRESLPITQGENNSGLFELPASVADSMYADRRMT
jgi:hypothetical protein